MSGLDLHAALKAMRDFTETMERIRTAQGMAKEQLGQIAQGILTLAVPPPVPEQMTRLHNLCIGRGMTEKRWREIEQDVKNYAATTPYSVEDVARRLADRLCGLIYTSRKDGA